jgi:aminopeptidase N
MSSLPFSSNALRCSGFVDFVFVFCLQSDKVALSNMPETRTTALANGWKQVQFDPSVRMSTYLVALIVCDFGSIQNYTIPVLPSGQPVLVRVWAPMEKLSQAALGLDAAVRIVPAYERFFGLAYPLKKLDLIAIPDFAAGAVRPSPPIWASFPFHDMRFVGNRWKIGV